MVRITAFGFHVEAQAACLGEAAEDVRGHSGVELQPQLRRPSPAEVDRGARERVVHREDGVAEAGDSATVSERAVQELYGLSEMALIG